MGVAIEMGLGLRVTSIIHGLYEPLCRAGGAELDHSALVFQIQESDR